MQTIKRKYWHALAWFKAHVAPGWVAVILTIIIVAPMLFISPIHGYADNGDFWRAIYPNRIYPYAAASRADYFNYVAPHYHIMQFFNENKMEVYSSQTLIIRAALFLNQLFFSKTVFDIRFLAAVYMVLFLGAIYMLTQALTVPVRRVRSYLIAIMVVFIFADSGFTLYFNSFFGEPAGYIALLYAVAAWLLLARTKPKHMWPLLLTYFGAVVFFITSKQQNAPIALSFVVVTLGLLAVKRVRKAWPYLAVGAGVIAASGVITFALISKDFNDINVYQSFTNGVLVDNKKAVKSIKDAGISGQYALMRDEAYNPPSYSAILPSDAYTKKHLVSKLSTAWFVKYYLKHPVQFMDLLDVSAKNQMIIQPTMVGDYTKDSGAKPLQQVRYFTTVSLMGRAFYPRRYVFGLLVAFTLTIVFSVGLFADLKRGEREGPMRFTLIMGLLTIIIFVPIVSIIGDGTADLAKHLFNIPVAIYLIIAILIADGLNGRLWHAYGEEEEDE
jgi:hypothetical protein